MWWQIDNWPECVFCCVLAICITAGTIYWRYSLTQVEIARVKAVAVSDAVRE